MLLALDIGLGASVTAIDRLAIVFGVLFGVIYLLCQGGEPIFGQLGLFLTAVLWAFFRAIAWAVAPRTARK